jgi:hypothetical protein
MKKLLITLAALVGLTACAAPAPPAIKTAEEKIGNLTIQAPVGWEKITDDKSKEFTRYSYYVESNDETQAFLSIYYNKDPNPDFSISDFDSYFDANQMNTNSDTIYTYDSINDDFLGNKPIRKASGTWYDGKLYDRTFVMMYDADCKRIAVEYNYLDELADKGYADYADTLLDTMQLIYDYQYTTAQ